MFVLRQVVVLGVGVVGFGLGVGAGMMLAHRTPFPAAPDAEQAPVAPPPAPIVPPAQPVPQGPPVVGITPAPTPGAFYAIGDRDTLADIARKAYGGTRRVPDLRSANPELDPLRLKPGTFVYVPVGAEPRPPAPRPLRASAARTPR